MDSPELGLQKILATKSTGLLLTTSLICGSLSALSFIYSDLLWLSFFGHLYLFLIASSYPYLKSAFSASTFGFAYFSLGLLWLFDITSQYAGLSKLITVVVLSGNILLQASYYGLFAVIAVRVAKSVGYSYWLFLVAMPSIACLIEWLRGWLFTGFPWFNSGYLLVDFGFASLLPVTGILGLSFLFYLFVGAACLVVKHPRKKLLVVTFFGVIAISGIAAALLKNIHWTTPTPSGPIQTHIIHGNFGLKGRDRNASVIDRINRYIALTGRSPKPQISLWPESTSSVDFNLVRNKISAPFRNLSANGTDVFMGGYIEEKGKTYNTIISNTGNSPVYVKQHLIPFGEYTPAWFTQFSALLPNTHMSDLTSGNAETIVTTQQGLKLAPSICFEIIFGDELRHRAHRSNFQIHVSDFGWFESQWVGSYFLLNARARSIESQKPMMYSTNRGISAFIDRDGSIAQRSHKSSPRAMYGEIIPRTGETLYTENGSYPMVVVCFFLLAVSFLFPTIFSKKS